MQKILVIEGNSTFRKNLLLFLSLENFQGIGAEDGMTGLRLIKSERPALVVCDWELSDIDGYSILTALRSDVATKDIKLILLCSDLDNSACQLIAQFKPDACLAKPVQLKDLAQEINLQLNQVNSRLLEVSVA